MKGGDTEEVRQSQHSRRSGKAVEQMQLETSLRVWENQREPGDSESIALPARRVTAGPGQVSSVHEQRKGATSPWLSLLSKQARNSCFSFRSISFFPLPTPPFLFRFLYIGQVCLNPTLWFRLPKNYNSHIPASLVLWLLNMPWQLTPNTSRDSYAPPIYYIQSLVSVAQNQECELSHSVLTTALWGSQSGGIVSPEHRRVPSGRMDTQARVFRVLIQDAFHCKRNWAHYSLLRTVDCSLGSQT